MATTSDARAVKSLNTSAGRRRFVFKTFSQQVEEININVYRSLDPVKSEPSGGSSFFRDCLLEWRELNTAEDFISFYEEMVPFVQTLPQILLHKELIISKLLSRLKLKARLSLEPILRLIGSLSRDLLEDFVPFIKRIANSLFLLLKNGADREPEIIEQIFTMWSNIMMFLQKYLVKDIIHVLKITIKFRYYPKEYIVEFMAESVSFLLRNGSIEQLIKGVRRIMFEAVKEQTRKSSVSALLCYVLRGTSRLHSRAEQVLRLLMDNSLFSIGGKVAERSNFAPEVDSGIVLEVLITTFQRLRDELQPVELNMMWNCMYEEIADCISNENLAHLSRLLLLFISTLQNGYVHKISDYQPVIQLIGLLIQNFVGPFRNANPTVRFLDISNKVLQLMPCILEGLYSNDVSALSRVRLEWASAFEFRNLSVLSFIKEIISKNPGIIHAFKADILSVLNDLMETATEEATSLLLIFFERLQLESFSFLDGRSKEKLTRICSIFQEAINYWIRMLNDAANDNSSCFCIEENKLALLWGIINCYPFVTDEKENSLLLLNLINALDKFLISSDNKNQLKDTWQSLIGAALASYHKLHSDCKIHESVVAMSLSLAQRYKSAPQVLSSVADVLDDVYGPRIQGGNKTDNIELKGGHLDDAIDIFFENLCHYNKVIRLSTLRILSHFELLTGTKDKADQLEVGSEFAQPCYESDQGCNVLKLLFMIESTPLSITTSRKVILLISQIQMGLSAAKISETHLCFVLNGIVGIFHNRFSYLWDPTQECLAVIIRQYSGMVWNSFIEYFERCQSFFLASHSQSDSEDNYPANKFGDLFERFNLFACCPSEGTPYATVLSLLIQSLQKVPDISESRSRQIVPLFLKFMGYNVDNLVSGSSCKSQLYKGKKWKSVLTEWLHLLILMRNPKSFYYSQFLKDVLQYRLLEENDPEIQMKVFNCLLNWKDDFLISYDQHLKNLISAKTLREELGVWSLSRESGLIDERHRAYIVPIVILILSPKVRNLKILASRKHASLNHRRAVLAFLTQLDVEELPFFFGLLFKHLKFSQGQDDVPDNDLFNLYGSSKNDLDLSGFLKQFTKDNIMPLSWKKKYGFLHVVEDIVGVFDELHIAPFLDLLMGFVVRVLESCTSSLDSLKSSRSSVSTSDSVLTLTANEKENAMEGQIMNNTEMKQYKELRSLALKIISFVLNKYEDHDFGYGFWELFFSSVKSLIDGFRNEGASSEKPSSLFSCFLAMSRSYKFASLLEREKNLVPDIFSMLTVTTASDAILSCVFKFIENLLKLDSELGNEENTAKRVFLPNLDVLVSSLHWRFTRNSSTKRKCPGGVELDVLKLVAKYVMDPSVARKFVDILLPILAKRSRSSDACVETLQVIRHVIKGVGIEYTSKILNAVYPLLISAGQDVRLSICDVLDALAENDSSITVVATLLRELNATSEMEISCLDYDTIISAYEKINKDFFYAVGEEHALVILSHSMHDMASEELVLRQSANRIVLLFIDFCSEILEKDMSSDLSCWSGRRLQNIINDFLLKHIGNAVDGETSVQKVWMDLLRELVLKFPKMPNFSSLRILCSEDAEQDFFHNIIHLQKHRRARTLSRFKHILSSGSLPKAVINKVFVPLIFNMFIHLQNGKGENIRISCLEALASISGCMEWKSYYSLLMRCFREIKLKPDKQKALLRLLCSILDHFHFSRNEGKNMGNVSNSGGSIETSSTCLKECTSSISSDIQSCLGKVLLPKVHQMLTSDSDHVNVNISLVALKILKLLPGDMMDLRLPNIIHRISNFLKNRLESIRDEARFALAACLKELGINYLQFIVRVLRNTLKRGYELHVLGYTLNFILSKCLLNPAVGELDYCLEDLLSVVEHDILGGVSEEKEVEKIASKMKETRKSKSFETLKLIAQSITFKTHALKLLSPVTAHLHEQLSPKLKSKLQSMLHHIAAGIECNPSVNFADLFIFTYGLIEDGISDECHKHKNYHEDEQKGEGMESSRLVHINPQYSYLVTVFSLEVLYSKIKHVKLHKEAEEILSMLDPFLKLLGHCLRSKYEDILSATLRCLSRLVKLPLPSLESQADGIKMSLLVIAQSLVTSGSPLMETCLGLLKVLLQSTRITLSTDQLYGLIHLPVFVDIVKNPSSIALSLLKAIVSRKLVVHEIYDIVTRIAELMVTSQVESVRMRCSKILLQFLLDYQLSEKRLQQHLDFLFANLRYEHASGREAVLEMLRAIIFKFPKGVLDEQSQTIFIHLVLCMANDHNSSVRSMTAVVIKDLIERVSPHSLNSILEFSLSWYLGGKQHLLSAAAQILGLLVGVMKKGDINRIFPAMRNILQSAISVVTNVEMDPSTETIVPLWKEAYYSLVMFEKILHQHCKLYLEKDIEDVWDKICEFLLYPHMWLRTMSNRLIDIYFVVVCGAAKENSTSVPKTLPLNRPTKLLFIALSLCCQLKVQLLDDVTTTLITKNLVFAICSLYSILGENGNTDSRKLWTTIGHQEKASLFKVLDLLDTKNGKDMFIFLTSGLDASDPMQNSMHMQYKIINYLLKQMAKIAIQMESIQMKIVFSSFKLMSPTILNGFNDPSRVGEDDCHNYAYQILLPLYKVSEGYAGKVVTDDVKQLATEVSDNINETIGTQNFVRIYSQIRTRLKEKRERRKRAYKIIAAVDPMRHAKRKLRIAAKHRANKKRKIMTMKMGRLY